MLRRFRWLALLFFLTAACTTGQGTTRTLVVGDRGGRVVVIDSETLEDMCVFEAGGAVMSIAFAPDGDSVYVAALERAVERWDLTMLIRSTAQIRSTEKD